jgi:quinol-cytochrome oxidoreductase complex cytochrome b subunit
MKKFVYTVIIFLILLIVFMLIKPEAAKYIFSPIRNRNKFLTPPKVEVQVRLWGSRSCVLKS